MKTLAVFLALASLAAVFLHETSTKSTETDFQKHMRQYGLKFESAFEQAFRERIFNENVAKINAHNRLLGRSYDQGVNQFTHLTQEEFASTYLGTVVPGAENIVVDETMPENLQDTDWTAQGAVTPVKNQGQCGSCWAFSSTGALEGLSKIGFGSLQSFSEQQLVDCSGSYGNQGCNGGLMDNAFKYVKDHGITTEAAYPYKAVKGTCTTNTGAFKISSYTDDRGCTALASAITKAPISVAVDASNWSSYKSGVLSSCGTSLNHGVTLTGTIGGVWRIKNSWGTSWGESGYIRLATGNTCGVCNQPSHPNK